MAFTGSATTELISESCVRITGTLALAAAASGTIALHGASGGEVVLPEGFMPVPYANVSLADQIDVKINWVTSVATSVPIRIVKTGTKNLDFQITLTNDSGGTTSAQMEIYVTHVPD